MALTNKLTAIADAIRAKTGTTNTLTLDEMPTAISNISSGGDIPEEAFNITGDCSSRFSDGIWDWFIENYGNRITTSSITGAQYMFKSSKVTSIPFDINLSTSSSVNVGNMFQLCSNLETLPYITGKIGEYMYMFASCYKLNYIPEDWATKIDWSSQNDNSSYNFISNAFYQCYSLKRIPQNLIDSLYLSFPYGDNNNCYPYYNQYRYCYALEELQNIPVSYYSSGNTSNLFSGFVNACNRLKSLAFKTNNGTPIVAKWKNQTIDLSNYVGYASKAGNITGYNSGLTTSTQIIDATSYQSLKNNQDSWTTLIEYSRYNHDSAVETINSLPDTSEYLATAGGTNTIKFKGESGSATDGGAINTLTEAEIAVATAKGWTVSIV